MTIRSSTVPILATLAILFTLLGSAYMGGYFWLGELDEYRGWQGHHRKRIYSQAWLSRVYVPAAKVESWLTGAAVHIAYFDPEFGGRVYQPED